MAEKEPPSLEYEEMVRKDHEPRRRVRVSKSKRDGARPTSSADKQGSKTEQQAGSSRDDSTRTLVQSTVKRKNRAKERTPTVPKRKLRSPTPSTAESAEAADDSAADPHYVAGGRPTDESGDEDESGSRHSDNLSDIVNQHLEAHKRKKQKLPQRRPQSKSRAQPHLRRKRARYWSEAELVRLFTSANYYLHDLKGPYKYVGDSSRQKFLARQRITADVNEGVPKNMWRPLAEVKSKLGHYQTDAKRAHEGLVKRYGWSGAEKVPDEEQLPQSMILALEFTGVSAVVGIAGLQAAPLDLKPPSAMSAPNPREIVLRENLLKDRKEGDRPPLTKAVDSGRKRGRVEEEESTDDDDDEDVLYDKYGNLVVLTKRGGGATPSKVRRTSNPIDMWEAVSSTEKKKKLNRKRQIKNKGEVDSSVLAQTLDTEDEINRPVTPPDTRKRSTDRRRERSVTPPVKYKPSQEESGRRTEGGRDRSETPPVKYKQAQEESADLMEQIQNYDLSESDEGGDTLPDITARSSKSKSTKTKDNLLKLMAIDPGDILPPRVSKYFPPSAKKDKELALLLAETRRKKAEAAAGDGAKKKVKPGKPRHEEPKVRREGLWQTIEEDGTTAGHSSKRQPSATATRDSSVAPQPNTRAVPKKKPVVEDLYSDAEADSAAHQPPTRRVPQKKRAREEISSDNDTDSDAEDVSPENTVVLDAGCASPDMEEPADDLDTSLPRPKFQFHPTETSSVKKIRPTLKEDGAVLLEKVRESEEERSRPKSASPDPQEENESHTQDPGCVEPEQEEPDDQVAEPESSQEQDPGEVQEEAEVVQEEHANEEADREASDLADIRQELQNFSTALEKNNKLVQQTLEKLTISQINTTGTMKMMIRALYGYNQSDSQTQTILNDNTIRGMFPQVDTVQDDVLLMPQHLHLGNIDGPVERVAEGAMRFPPTGLGSAELEAAKVLTTLHTRTQTTNTLTEVMTASKAADDHQQAQPQPQPSTSKVSVTPPRVPTPQPQPCASQVSVSPPRPTTTPPQPEPSTSKDKVDAPRRTKPKPQPQPFTSNVKATAARLATAQPSAPTKTVVRRVSTGGSASGETPEKPILIDSNPTSPSRTEGAAVAPGPPPTARHAGRLRRVIEKPSKGGVITRGRKGNTKRK